MVCGRYPMRIDEMWKADEIIKKIGELSVNRKWRQRKSWLTVLRGVGEHILCGVDEENVVGLRRFRERE